MGNVGRSIYLVIPFLLTLVSLILLLITLLNLSSGTSSQFFDSLYFLRVNATDIKASVGGKSIEIKNVAGFYDVGLFRYCSGTASSQLPNFCSDAQLGFAFDPAQIWNASNIANLADKEYTDAISAYHSVSKFVSAAYIIAFVALALSMILGLMTFCLSRITNFMTTLVSAVGTVFLCLASAAATGMFVTLKGALYAKLHQYNVGTDIGNKALAFTWLAAAVAIVATFFWSCGCCCGHDRSASHHKNKRVNSLYARNAYERVPSPMGHHTAYSAHNESSVPLQPYGAPFHGAPQHGYEPYRAHQAV